jgi:two-component system sensor histidine kinase HydH
MSPTQFSQLQAEIMRHYCAFGMEDHFHPAFCVAGGAASGLLFGVADALFCDMMGFKVFLHGHEALSWQIIFHSLVFGLVGALMGKLVARRLQLKAALRIIQRQYDDLAARQQQLVQSEKLALVGRLSASIAHEIRNPLGIMRSSAGLVASDLPAEHPGQQPLGFIAEEIDRVSGLIESLLRLAKPKDPVLAPTHLNELLSRSLTFMAPELRKHQIRVEERFDTNLPEVLADSDQIQQVFMGLVLNATQAIGTQGTITVTTSFSADPQHPKVRIAVADTGSGIRAENLERIFEPFFTTRSEGTGLGLAVARQIIDGHGGRIAAESSEEGGATFSIFLPLAGTVSAA